MKLVKLRFRTRLALVMLLTMGCTSAILMWTYIQENNRIKAYVAGVTSDLLTISAATQQQLPATKDQKQALQAYMKALTDAGFSTVTVADPTGEVLASTDPGLLQKKIKIPKRRAYTRRTWTLTRASSRSITPFGFRSSRVIR